MDRGYLPSGDFDDVETPRHIEYTDMGAVLIVTRLPHAEILPNVEVAVMHDDSEVSRGGIIYILTQRLDQMAHNTEPDENEFDNEEGFSEGPNAITNSNFDDGGEWDEDGAGNDEGDWPMQGIDRRADSGFEIYQDLDGDTVVESSDVATHDAVLDESDNKENIPPDDVEQLHLSRRSSASDDNDVDEAFHGEPKQKCKCVRRRMRPTVAHRYRRQGMGRFRVLRQLKEWLRQHRFWKLW